jgi:flagellar FliJ protein
MDRMQLLATLLEREEERRDAALSAWRRAQQQAEQAQQQHEALLSYRNDYRQRWSAQFQQRATMEILRCYQGFIERLDQAITAQQGNAAFADQQLAQALAHLRQRETRVAMVRKLMERRRQAQAQQQDRRDQRQSDEAAQRMGWAARQALAAA